MNFSYKITETSAGQSVDTFLRANGFSRRLIIELKKEEAGLMIDNKRVFTNHLLSFGEELSIHLPEEEPTEKITPVPLPFSVIYEDEHLIAVNKPADMPIHPSIHNYENTLANAAAWYWKEHQISGPFRCINRLDRDTTGLVLLAKHHLSGSILSDMVKKRLIKREYLAIVEGTLSEGGTVSLPIGRVPGSAILRQVDIENGERAITHYEPLVSENNLTLLRIHLETGRTHQIRVHMNAIGHPLPGDYLYHPTYERIKRQPLHSASLSFLHPITKTAMHLTAPVPEDMKNLFTRFFHE